VNGRRALPAARGVATDYGLARQQAVVVYSGSNALVRLCPAPVLAHLMTGPVMLHDAPERWLERDASGLSFLAPSGIALAPKALPHLSPTRTVDIAPASIPSSQDRSHTDRHQQDRT
jgi:hypothetical protein